ncbi:hypothetical protein R9X50_00779500 [Acrodontium crateriforme]|uniref:Amidohydrolase-related domain-containing protein n=1 Tax=Acrodontium crateriforme TaxID=150365 RepID=A0AAQ3MCR3_9PEZI|nr:hypothetical protein R9X50_00779500 [Acrodontium crateriforme]
MLPPLIALEEHFMCSAILDDETSQVRAKFVGQIKAIPGIEDQLRDLSTRRLEDMDKGQISFQIISHAPAGPSLAQCLSANDQLAAAVEENRERFAGFAVLPVGDPLNCARELQRAVKQLGMVGALIDNHAEGTYYDSEEHYPLWQKAEELDVPIYLHPTWPSDSMLPQYSGNFTDLAGRSMGASGWGWHSETGLHVLRLYAAGIFDRFPRLKIIIGHFGEMIPFMLDRISSLSVRWGEQKRKFKEVYDENIWITTSGVWSLDPMRCILHNTKIEHILYSVDYPFAKNEWGLAWMEELEQSGLVTREQLEMIAYKNSEKLLRVKAPSRSST